MNKEDEFETDEEETCYYRVNIENASKIKNDIIKLKKYHSRKVKRLDKTEIDSVETVNKYIYDNIIGKCFIYNDNNNNNNNSNSNNVNEPVAVIGGNEYVMVNKPEIGTNMLFEYDESTKSVSFVSNCERYYEVNVLKQKKRNNSKAKQHKEENAVKNGKAKRKAKSKAKKMLKEIATSEIKVNDDDDNNVKECINTSVNVNANMNMNVNDVGNVNGIKRCLNKKRKRRKRKYIKQSTIIELKKL